MNLKKAFLASIAAFCAAAVPCFAQEDESAGAAAEQSGPSLPGLRPAREFYIGSIRCTMASGTVLVRKPGEKEWVAVEAGRHYRLGSSFRCETKEKNPRVSSAEFALGEEPRIVISNNTEFATAPATIDDPKRMISLVEGRLCARFPPISTNDTFKLATGGFSCKNITGEAWFDTKRQPDGERTTVRVASGTLTLDGLHFSVPEMKASNQFTIRTLEDGPFTSIRGEGGIFKIRISQGVERLLDTSTGEMKDEPRFLDFEMSPRAVVKIHRNRIPETERFIVCTMTFDAAGNLKNRCAFADEKWNINTGEMVVQDKDKLPEEPAPAAPAAEDPFAPAPDESLPGDSGNAAGDDDMII